MGKKVLLLSGSPRKRGNSDILCDRFVEGAEAAGHQAEKIYVAGKKVSYCIGCGVCRKNGGTCVHEDDAAEILEKMITADVIVLASPVYFYSMDAQLKTLIDRTYSRFTEMRDKDIYLILTGAAPDKSYMDTAIASLRGFVRCLPDAQEKGVIYGVGVVEAEDIEKTDAAWEAYEMGRAV